jgi:hypothetical protein
MSGSVRHHAAPRDRRAAGREEAIPPSGRFRKPAAALAIGLSEPELPDESERIALPGSPHALVFHRKLLVRISRDGEGYPEARCRERR